MSGLGQTRKYSLRVDVFRFSPESGHRATRSACPKSASSCHPPWCLGCDAKHRLQQHMLRRGLERSQAVPADAVLARPGTLAHGYAHGVAALRLFLEVGV
jgi:hypothetical protein